MSQSKRESMPLINPQLRRRNILKFNKFTNPKNGYQIGESHTELQKPSHESIQQSILMRLPLKKQQNFETSRSSRGEQTSKKSIPSIFLKDSLQHIHPDKDNYYSNPHIDTKSSLNFFNQKKTSSPNLENCSSLTLQNILSKKKLNDLQNISSSKSHMNENRIGYFCFKLGNFYIIDSDSSILQNYLSRLKNQSFTKEIEIKDKLATNNNENGEKNLFQERFFPKKKDLKEKTKITSSQFATQNEIKQLQFQQFQWFVIKFAQNIQTFFQQKFEKNKLKYFSKIPCFTHRIENIIFGTEKNKAEQLEQIKNPQILQQIILNDMAMHKNTKQPLDQSFYETIKLQQKAESLESPLRKNKPKLSDSPSSPFRRIPLRNKRDLQSSTNNEQRVGIVSGYIDNNLFKQLQCFNSYLEIFINQKIDKEIYNKTQVFNMNKQLYKQRLQDYCSKKDQQNISFLEENVLIPQTEKNKMKNNIYQSISDSLESFENRLGKLIHVESDTRTKAQLINKIDSLIQ